MPTLLKGATLVEFEPASIDCADLRVANGVITARGVLTPEPGEEVIDLSGRLVFPGLVSAHHRLHALALRGFKRAQRGPQGEAQALSALEAALTLDDAEALAAAGGLEGLFAGTTTVFHTHGAAQALGTLNSTAHGLSGVGLRAVLACEVSDQYGEVSREEALEECLSYADRARGRFRAAFALGPLSQVSDAALAGLGRARAGRANPPLLFGCLAEDAHEERACAEKFGQTAVDRVLGAGLVTTASVWSHNVHLSWPQLSDLISQGPWMVHVPRGNMASQVGLATPAKFGVRTCVGTGALALDALGEAQLATLRGLEVGQPLNILRLLANGHRLASEAFGATVGPLREGAVADLVVADYQPTAPLEVGNLAEHVLHGFSTRDVESVMVDGLWRLWKRKPLAVDPKDVARLARERTAALWVRMGSAVVPEPRVAAG